MSAKKFKKTFDPLGGPNSFTASSSDDEKSEDREPENEPEKEPEKESKKKPKKRRRKDHESELRRGINERRLAMVGLSRVLGYLRYGILTLDPTMSEAFDKIRGIFFRPAVYGRMKTARDVIITNFNKDWTLDELMYSDQVNTYYAFFIDMIAKTSPSHTNTAFTNHGAAVLYGSTNAQMTYGTSRYVYLMKFFARVERKSPGLLVFNRLG